MNSSSSSGSRSIIVIHCRAPPVARSATDARSRTASAISRACSSISRSISTRNRSSLPSKFEYSAPVEKPASEAISSTEAPWKPLRANTLRAAASRRSRVFARLCSRVMRGRRRARVPARLGARHRSILLDRAIAIPITFVIRTRPSATGADTMASATTPHPRPLRQRRQPADRRDLLRGPLRALGARQLAGDRARLHRGRAPVARGLHRVRAPGGAVELLPVLLGRGRRRRQPLALHRRRAAGGAEVLPDHPAGRRGAPRGLLQALHAGGLRDRRRLDGERPAGDQAAADARASARSSTASTRWPTSCAPTARRRSSRRR